MKRTAQISISALAVLMLAGCGYHLRGSDGTQAAMSVNYDYSISIRTSVSEFRVKLAEALVRREFNLVVQDGDYHVDIFDEQYNENDFELIEDTLGLDIRTLNYSISFRLMKNGQDVIVASQTIAISKDYSRIGEQEVARDAATWDALERTRQQSAELLADRLVALIQGE